MAQKILVEVRRVRLVRRCIAFGIVAFALAGCATTPSLTQSARLGWDETSPGVFEAAAGLDFAALSLAHREHRPFTIDLPGVGNVTIEAMPHGKAPVQAWSRDGATWRPAAQVPALSWGHGHVAGYNGDASRDSSVELAATEAGWEGVLGIVDGTERLFRFWVVEEGGQPVRRATVERTECYRPQDYTWIFGCGRDPVQEGEVAPMG